MFAKNESLENCKKYLKYRALVTFRLATQDISVTVTSKRLTFFDKLSAFGEKYIKGFIVTTLIYRWNSGIVHWNEYP